MGEWESVAKYSLLWPTDKVFRHIFYKVPQKILARIKYHPLIPFSQHQSNRTEDRLMKNSSTCVSLCITLNILHLGFYFESHSRRQRNNECSTFLENDILLCFSITINISGIYHSRMHIFQNSIDE